jgi:hypothetical protein
MSDTQTRCEQFNADERIAELERELAAACRDAAINAEETAKWIEKWHKLNRELAAERREPDAVVGLQCPVLLYDGTWTREVNIAHLLKPLKVGTKLYAIDAARKEEGK